MSSREHLWVVVLAAEGATVSASMLRRASSLVPLSRVVAVVAREHRALWEENLRDLPLDNMIVQPQDRGTAAGVLLPCLEIFLHRDPQARFLVLPADHVVADENLFGRSLLAAVEATDEATDRCALVNGFMVAAEARTLIRLYEDTLPGLLRAFLGALRDGHRDLSDLYGGIPIADFSRNVLQHSTESLSVLSVPRCGWGDLGTPEPFADWQSRQRSRPRAALPRELADWAIPRLKPVSPE